MALSINNFFKLRPRRSAKRHAIVCGDGTLLLGGVLMASLAITGIAGIIWQPLHFVARYAIVYATFLSPAFLAVALTDLFKLGWSWKRAFAIALISVALGLVVLAFHEILSATPFLKRN